MKLFEYEAKVFFSKFGIPIPRGCVASSPEEAEKIAEEIGGPVAVKSQLLVGGRGKAGGIKFADTPIEAGEITRNLLSTKIKGLKVTKVLIEEKLVIEDEIYVGVVVDRRNKSYIVLASSEGGIDIEEVAFKTPGKIVRELIDPLKGLMGEEAVYIAEKMGYANEDAKSFGSIILKLYKLAYNMDAELTEINPLAYTKDGFVAADARLNIDNNALFRHPELTDRCSEDEETELTLREKEALKLGLTYVELIGNIGIIGNGAGLTMATLDIVTLQGGKPANFLDLGGGASIESVTRGIEFVLSDKKVKVLFVNIFGGITRCDDIARGIIEARKKMGTKKPIVVRLMGTNEYEGMRLLKGAGIDTYDTMEKAAERVVNLVEVP